MLKKVITYTDFNGEERNEALYFNLSKPELMSMKRAPIADMLKNIQYLAKEGDNLSDVEKDVISDQIAGVFEDLILSAYGEKSADGRRFMKVDADGRKLSKEFSETQAYSELFMELVSDPSASEAFLTGILPSDIVAQIKAEENAAGNNVVSLN